MMLVLTISGGLLHGEALLARITKNLHGSPYRFSSSVRPLEGTTELWLEMKFSLRGGPLEPVRDWAPLLRRLFGMLPIGGKAEMACPAGEKRSSIIVDRLAKAC